MAGPIYHLQIFAMRQFTLCLDQIPTNQHKALLNPFPSICDLGTELVPRPQLPLSQLDPFESRIDT